MNRVFRRCALVLVAFVLIGVVAVCALSRSTQAQAETSIQPGPEITSMRTENSRSYELADGRIMTAVYGGDIYYKDEAGDLVPIDNSLSDSPGKSGYRYTNRANSWHASFADTLGSDLGVLLEKGKASLSFGLASNSRPAT